MIISDRILRKIINRTLLKESVSIVDAAKGFLGIDESELEKINFDFDVIVNNKSANIAIEENKFWKNGEIKETDKNAYSRLKTYWDNLTDSWPEDRWTPDGTPWSAAFVSYCMKKSGESFYDSAAHSVYAGKALENRKKLISDPNSFKGKTMHVLFLKGESEPSVGDGLFYLREGNISSWINGGGGQAPSHCDIYIGNNTAIGGNLSNSCIKTKAFGKHEALIKKIKIIGAEELTDKAEGESDKTGGSSVAPAT